MASGTIKQGKFSWCVCSASPVGTVQCCTVAVVTEIMPAGKHVWLHLLSYLLLSANYMTRQLCLCRLCVLLTELVFPTTSFICAISIDCGLHYSPALIANR